MQIFISYAREDRAWVEVFADALMSCGWSVCWDRTIPTGHCFDVVIQQALETAQCVIVVWSRRSVQSDWVKAEAAIGRKRNVLLPVLVDGVDLPLEFSRLQTQVLVDWKGNHEHAGFSQLINDITRILATPIQVSPRPRTLRGVGGFHLAFLILPSGILLISMGILMVWSIPTWIHIELATERLAFFVRESPLEAQPSLAVRSLAIEKFATISFVPEIMKVADLGQYDFQSDAFPDSAWIPLEMRGETIQLSARDFSRHPRVMIEPFSSDRGPITLSPLELLPGSRVVVEARGEEKKGLTIRLADQGQSELGIRGLVQITSQHTDINGFGSSLLQDQDEVTYKIQLRESAPWLNIEGQANGPVFSPTFMFPDGQSMVPILKGVPITELDFDRQDPSGARVSAMTGKGKVSFPAYPHLGQVIISESDALGLQGLHRFTIAQLVLLKNAKGLLLVGDGFADQISTKAGQIPINYRLTAFDALWFRQRILLICVGILWVALTMLGAYRVYGDIRRL